MLFLLTFVTVWNTDAFYGSIVASISDNCLSCEFLVISHATTYFYKLPPHAHSSSNRPVGVCRHNAQRGRSTHSCLVGRYVYITVDLTITVAPFGGIPSYWPHLVKDGPFSCSAVTGHSWLLTKTAKSSTILQRQTKTKTSSTPPTLMQIWSMGDHTMHIKYHGC